MDGLGQDRGNIFKRKADDQDSLKALIKLAQGGDKAAYTALLKELSVLIRQYLAGRLANPDWIDDITQESLISVHKSLHTYRTDRPFRPWLYAIVSFRKNDYLRKHYSQRQDRHTDIDDPSLEQNHIVQPAFTGELKDIERFWAKLSAKQRLIFGKMRIEGYTAAEIAAQTGLSETNIKVTIHRIQKKLNAFAKA